MAERVLPTSFRLTVETPGPVDGEPIWMRVVGYPDGPQTTYTLKPGGDPFGNTAENWEKFDGLPRLYLETDEGGSDG